MTLWAKIITTGSEIPSLDMHAKRTIKLTNSVSLFCFLLCTLLFISYSTLVNWNLITVAIPSVGILCLGTIILNFYRKTTAGRIWICFLIPISCLLISIISKLNGETIQDSEYYEFRIIILGASVFPFLLFSFDNKKILAISLGFSLACLLLFDPIHNLLGVGYYQTGQHDKTYYFTNIVFFIAYAGLLGTINFLKSAFEHSENLNVTLINDLNKAKQSLESINATMSKQNKEILLQSRILKDSQKNLSQAYDLIEQQRDLLSHKNKNLELELINKSQELTASNSELIKHNTELSQFSYTISHNLRGPLASLLGLLDLIERIQFSPEDKVIIDHIKNAIFKMESTIKDLTKIVDVRDNIFKIRQHFTLRPEIRRALDLLKEKIDINHVTIHENLKIENIYSVRPMLQNILYNILSNSIKFRSPERSPEITIHSEETPHYYVLKVTDNGLGIDMKAHHKDIFKLYKRFHFHTEGKGLGLYMVKLQSELLGGAVDIASELNKFTTITIYLKKPQNVNQKLLHVEDSANIFYDPMINATGVIWNRPVTGGEYRSVFLKCIQQLHIYNTPNWISDVSKMGAISPADQQWVFREILPTAIQNGLRRVAIVQSESTHEEAAYINNIIPKFASMQINTLSFSNFEDAVLWIQHENEKSDAQNFQLIQ